VAATLTPIMLTITIRKTALIGLCRIAREPRHYILWTSDVELFTIRSAFRLSLCAA